MSDTPAWLTEDTTKVAVTLAKHPVMQSAAKTVASDPGVQKAAVGAATAHMRNSYDPTPSWAQPAETPTKSAGFGDVESGSNAVKESSPEMEIDEDTLRRMKNWHLCLRLSYMSAAIIMSAAAVLSLQVQPDLGLAFFAVYVFVFAILIFCFEVNLSICSRPIAVNFGFLYTLPGRLIFLLFVAFMVYSLSMPLAYAAFAILLAVGLLHIVVIFKFPRFTEYLRKLHYYNSGK